MIYTLTLNPAVDRELIIPRLELDTVLRAKSVVVDCGGKGINVSRALLALGVRSVASGFLGGNNGKFLLEGLHTSGISTDFVWLEQETRINISIFAEHDGHYIKVNENGPSVNSNDQQKMLAKVSELAQSGDWWILAGNLPPNVSQDFYATILKILNQQGANAILDTSGEALQFGLQERPFLVKPNAEEAGVLTGTSTETSVQLKNIATMIRGMGAQNVIISLGKQGALLQTRGGTWLAHAPTIEQKNPTGAGDSMVGGMVYALQRGLGMKEALTWGVACGAATASLPGTQVGSKNLVTSFLTDIHVEGI